MSLAGKQFNDRLNDRRLGQDRQKFSTREHADNLVGSRGGKSKGLTLHSNPKTHREGNRETHTDPWLGKKTPHSHRQPRIRRAQTEG